MRHLALAFFSIIILLPSACTHSSRRPEFLPTLKLEIDLQETVVHPGDYLKVTFRIVNNGDVSVDVCLPLGVSSRIRNSSYSYLRPLKLIGSDLDSTCTREFLLGSGESAAYTDRLWIWPDLPEGFAALEAFAMVGVPGPRGKSLGARSLDLKASSGALEVVAQDGRSSSTTTTGNTGQ